MSKNNNTPSGGGNTSPTGSILGPIIGAGLSWGKDAWQNKKNRELEAKRRKYDQEQWERQNRYNHPIEQMARLKSAGLNPNLIYGSSPGSAVGNAGAIPAGQAPEYSLTNPVTGYMNTRVQQAQSNNLKADVLLKGTQGMKNLAEAGMTGRKLDQFNATFDNVVGQTASNAAIAKIKADIAARTAPQLILQSTTKTQADQVALKLKNIDLDFAIQGYPKGLLIPQVASALGFDLSTSTGREGFQLATIIAGSSRLFQMLTPALKSILPASKKLGKSLKSGFLNWKTKINK